MKLAICEYGAKVSTEGNCLQIKAGEEEHSFCADAVSELILGSHCSITAAAVKMCMEHDIELYLPDRFGEPCAIFMPFHHGSAPIVKRKQLYLQDSPFGVALAKEFLQIKLENRVNHLRSLAQNRRDERRQKINEAIEKIREYITMMEALSGNTMEEVRGTLQAYEGNAGRVYFSTISDLLLPEYQFHGRSGNPSYDSYNAMLNYGYGILYNKTNRYCNTARMDPYIGIMHVDSYNKPTFCFDLTEMFRIHAERTVFRLFSRKCVKQLHFDIDEEQGIYYLNKEGKALLVPEFYKEMEKLGYYKGKRISAERQMQQKILEISKRIEAMPF